MEENKKENRGTNTVFAVGCLGGTVLGVPLTQTGGFLFFSPLFCKPLTLVALRAQI